MNAWGKRGTWARSIKYIDCCDMQEDGAGVCTGMPCLVGTCNRAGGVLPLACARWKLAVQRGNAFKSAWQTCWGKNKTTLHFLLFNRTSQTGKCVYLQSASNPPMSCSFDFRPYMVRERRWRQKEGREKRKHFQKVSEQRGGGRCGLLLCIRWCYSPPFQNPVITLSCTLQTLWTRNSAVSLIEFVWV